MDEKVLEHIKKCVRMKELGENDLVAQLVEHWTFNPGVVGSSPTEIANLKV